MKNTDYRYSRLPVCLPSVLIATGWVAIWLIWAGTGTIPAQQRNRSRTRTIFSGNNMELRRYELPIIFARSSVSWPGNERETRNSDIFSGITMATPRFLEKPVTEGKPDTVNYEPLSAVIARSTDRYRPLWRKHRIFPEIDRAMSLCIHLSKTLTERKYALELPENIKDISREPWTIRLVVQISKDGRAENVFMQTSSGNRLIDSTIITAASSVKSPPGSSECEGILTVSCFRR